MAQTAVAATIASVPLGAQGPGPGWYDRPMRWAQVAFVEDDPGNFSPQFWFGYFRRTHCDAVCLGAGGGIAFYPTKIPLHYRSKFMGNSDPFGEMVAGCRKLGMNVIARTDPHAVHQDFFDAHPDWIAVDAAGKKRRHWAMPELWVTCALGPYNFDFMTEVTREIVSGYKVDGVFSNRWSGSGMCYCEHCARSFRDFSGLELPRGKADRDPRWSRYAVWHEQRLFELWTKWDKAIKAVNPDAGFIANSGGGAYSELNMKTIGEPAPTLFADRQARHGLMPPSSVHDLSDTCRAPVRKHFPKAWIVPDRLHAIRLVDHHFLGCRREVDPTGAKNRGLMSFMRRRRRDLKPEQRTKPGVYLEQHPAIRTIYRFKQMRYGTPCCRNWSHWAHL